MRKHRGFIQLATVILLLVTLLPLMGCRQTKTSPKLDLQPFSIDNKTVWAMDPAGDIYRSTDLAHHYSKVTPKGWKTETSSNTEPFGMGEPRAFYVSPNKQAWIADTVGTLFRTYNGGKTWKKIKKKLPEQDIFSTLHLTFYDALHGWLQNGSDLYKSNDGGESWTLISPSLPIAADSLLFTTNQKGFQGREDGLYSTVNGGEDWVNILSLTGEENVSYPTPRFFNEKDGIFQLHNFNKLGKQQVKIFRTTDGGASWKTEIKPPSALETESFFYIRFYDEKGGYASFISVNDLGEVLDSGMFHTKDGGIVWNEVKLKEVLKGHPYFVNEKEGIIEDFHSTLFETSDGGATWKSFIPLLKE